MGGGYCSHNGYACLRVFFGALVGVAQIDKSLNTKRKRCGVGRGFGDARLI